MLNQLITKNEQDVTVNMEYTEVLFESHLKLQYCMQMIKTQSVLHNHGLT